MCICTTWAFVDRPYCSGQSLEYIKKYGFNLPNSLALAKPAKHPEVLLAHMVKFAAALQSNFAGAIGWDAVNLFFAPYLEGLTDREVKQLAQILIFEFSQQAVARGGQAIFTDINLYWEVPKHFEDVPAIGPNGEYTGKTYSEYEKEAQRFVWKLFEVYKEGDGAGGPSSSPNPWCISPRSSSRPKATWSSCTTSATWPATRATPTFLFDRGETAKISECCRLSFKLEKRPGRRQDPLEDALLGPAERDHQPAAHRLRGGRRRHQTVQDPARAHRPGRPGPSAEARFHRRTSLNHGVTGPLALLAMELDGQKYLRMHRVTYLVGMVGLNEMVQQHLGQELHDTEEAMRFGLKVIAHMNLLCEYYAEQAQHALCAGADPGRSTAYRFAKLDLKLSRTRPATWSRRPSPDEVYYTNSTLFNVGATCEPHRAGQAGGPLPSPDRGRRHHPRLAGRAASLQGIHGQLRDQDIQGDQERPSGLQPRVHLLQELPANHRGLVRTPARPAASDELEHITRITGYFTRVSSWNKGKMGELKDRYRNPGFIKAQDKAKASGE
jgi:anaerobic ribonucleoside-triphosphate reductase